MFGALASSLSQYSSPSTVRISSQRGWRLGFMHRSSSSDPLVLVISKVGRKGLMRKVTRGWLIQSSSMIMPNLAIEILRQWGISRILTLVWILCIMSKGDLVRGRKHKPLFVWLESFNGHLVGCVRWVLLYYEGQEHLVKFLVADFLMTF